MKKKSLAQVSGLCLHQKCFPWWLCNRTSTSQSLVSPSRKGCEVWLTSLFLTRRRTMKQPWLWKIETAGEKTVQPVKLSMPPIIWLHPEHAQVLTAFNTRKGEKKTKERKTQSYQPLVRMSWKMLPVRWLRSLQNETCEELHNAQISLENITSKLLLKGMPSSIKVICCSFTVYNLYAHLVLFSLSV